MRCLRSSTCLQASNALAVEKPRNRANVLSGEGRFLAMDRALVPSIGRGLRRDQFGDADQIVGDQVEQEIGSNSGDAAMLGLAHCTVLFAPAEDAFGHRPARLRDAVALVPRGASVDGAAATLAG